MRSRKAPFRKPQIKGAAAEELVHALRTHQVDAIVGERHIMLVRLKQAEEDLELSRNQLRALTASLLSIRENERIVIAREIHDELGQALTCLQLGLSWIAGKMTARQQPVQEKVCSLAALVTTMIRTVQRIADELRPGVLDELGLVKALKSEARKFTGYTGTPCKFETNMGKAGCSREEGIAIFRIAQTALTNVARHASASRTVMSLTGGKTDLVLTVHDNGKGITREQISGAQSLGIIGIRERVLALKGSLNIRGSKTTGTTLTVRIPRFRILLGSGPVSS
ncbi:MAG: sensor histidine kinase [Nitrospira sp.]|nr:MAG: sensor histidine kinase [Nitrospira sp.]